MSDLGDMQCSMCRARLDLYEDEHGREFWECTECGQVFFNCPNCKGMGSVPDRDGIEWACEDCDGTGLVTE